MRSGPDHVPEAPTHLGSHQLPLPPEWLGVDDDQEPVTRAARGTPPVPVPVRARRESVPSLVRTERSVVQPVAHRSSVRRSEPVSASRKSESSSRKSERAASEAQAQAVAAGLGALDPMQVPVPPELGGPIYGWIRRLALQADLAGADRVLRDALADMTSSLSVSIIYPGQDGLWTLGADDEIPKEAKPIVAVAQARRALVASHTAIIPIVTSSETVGVILLTRNPRNPGYHPIEQVAMIALARESAAIMHHLAVQHLQKASEIQADKGSLYRGEALEAHRTRGNEGAPMQLTPGWVKRTYPILIGTLLIAVVASILVSVPTYSTGKGVVAVKGETHTAPSAGTVEQILVKPNQHVNKGAALLRLHSGTEHDELDAAEKEATNAKIQYLLDPQDEMVRKSLSAALVRVEREEARVESRTVRAKKDGTVLDIKPPPGALVQPGDPLVTIVDKGAEPEIVAFLPATDRPRLRVGMPLQVAIDGYTKMREIATITAIDNTVLGGTDAMKIVGAVAEPLKLQGGSWVIVRARLPARQFKTQSKTFNYHHGMTSKVEVKIQEKPFAATMFPAIEKYLPD